MDGKTKAHLMLKTQPFTDAECTLINKACMKEDGMKITRPRFYHDAIVEHAKQILGVKDGHSNN